MRTLASKKSDESALDKNRLLTLQEVATYLRASDATIRRWTRSGRLRCYRLGGQESRRLFSLKHVQEFLAQHETKTPDS